MSEAVRVLGDAEGADESGAERAESERRGAMSSGGPSGRLSC
jgi:hypothetical protein